MCCVMVQNGLNEFKLISSFATGLYPCVVLWFEEESDELNHPKLMSLVTADVLFFGLKRFERVEPP